MSDDINSLRILLAADELHLENCRKEFREAGYKLAAAADAVTITRNRLIKLSPNSVPASKKDHEIKDLRRSFVKNAIYKFNREFF